MVTFFFFSLPEYLFPWFLVPINSSQAASSRKNQGQQCRITKSIDEQSKAFSLSNHIFVFYISLILSSNAGNNPVQPEGKTAIAYSDNDVQPFITPGQCHDMPVLIQLYWNLTFRHWSDRSGHWENEHCCCSICTYNF